MPSYRRFVTYLFQYEHAVKTRNCGFAKVEIRQGKCRMELQVKGVPDGSVKVCLFTGPEKGFRGVPVGEFRIRNGAGTGSFSFATDPVGDTEWKMEDMGGIYLQEEDGNFAASQWEDEDLEWQNFRMYEKSDGNSSDQPEERDVPVQQEKKEDTGQKKEEVPQKEAEIQPEMQPEIHATRTTAAAVKSVPSENGNRIASYMNVWEKQWKQFSAAHPVFCPFDEAQDIFAVKMDLRDFKILPKQSLSLGNNSFLLHGYFNYKYLLFGYMEGEPRKWFLGVPGVFQNQEQLLAGLFGFGEFRTKHMTKQKTGEFGYWYRYLEL